MKIKTKRLLIRELKDKDLNDLIKQANNLNVSKYLAVVPFPYEEKDAKWFIDKCKEESKKEPRENYELAIEFEGKLIGVIGLTKVNRFVGTAYLGFWIGEEYWRKGIVSESAKEMIKFAFEKLKLRRINSDAYSENIASNGLLKKIGFKEEGFSKKKDRAKSTGEIHDVYVFGLLKEDWKG